MPFREKERGQTYPASTKPETARIVMMRVANQYMSNTQAQTLVDAMMVALDFPQRDADTRRRAMLDVADWLQPLDFALAERLRAAGQADGEKETR